MFALPCPGQENKNTQSYLSRDEFVVYIIVFGLMLSRDVFIQ